MSPTSASSGPAEAGRTAWSSAPSTALARYLLLGTVFVPFVFYRGVFFPYVTTRALVFRVLVELAGLVFLWQLLVREVEVADGRDPVVWALLAWLAAGLLSAVLSPATHHSLYGSMERMWGVSQWAHLFLFYLLVRTYFDRTWWAKFLRATLMVSVAVGLYALMEFGLARAPSWLWGIPGVGGAPTEFGSTLGNSGYLAAYALVHLVVAGAVFRRGGAGWRAFAVAAAGINVVSFAFGGSRALLLGVGAGAVVAAALWLWIAGREEGREVPWRSLGLGAGGAALVLVAARASGLLPPFAELPVVGRLAELGEGPAVIRRRLVAWEAGLEGFLERPLTGWGVENFHLAFDRFADPEFYRTGTPFKWDRAHNVLVGALAEAGVLGAAAYGALWAAAAARVRSSWREEVLGRSLAALVTLGFVASALYLLVWFGDQNSFFLLLALLAWVRFEGRDGAGAGEAVRMGAVRPPRVPRRVWLRRGVLVAVLLLGGAAVWRATNTWRAARLIVQGRTARGAEEAVQIYETARRLRVPQHRDVATRYAAFVDRWGRGASSSLRQGQDRELFQRAVVGAESAVNRALSRAPSDQRLLVSRAELAIGAYAGTGAEKAWNLAEESLGGAIRIAPDRLHYYGRLASYQWSTERREEARATLERGIGRYPAYPGLYRRRSLLHRLEGRRDSAVLDLRRSLWLEGDRKRREIGSDDPRRLAEAEAGAGRPGRAADLLADWAAGRYEPALWRELERPERRAFLEEVGLAEEVRPSSSDEYPIAPGDLYLFVRWHRYARAAGDTAQARLAIEAALDGLSETNRTARLREDLLGLADSGAGGRGAGGTEESGATGDRGETGEGAR